MSKTVHWEEDIAKLCDMWRQNTWYPYKVVQHAVCLVSKRFTECLKWRYKYNYSKYSNNNDDANLYYNEDFIQKLAYLVDIFEKLSNLDKSMQSPEINTLTQDDKVNEIMKKLESWKRNTECNIFDILPTFESSRLSTDTETNEKLSISHLGDLQRQFSLHFKVVNVSKFEWVRKPFAANNIMD